MTVRVPRASVYNAREACVNARDEIALVEDAMRNLLNYSLIKSHLALVEDAISLGVPTVGHSARERTPAPS